MPAINVKYNKEKIDFVADKSFGVLDLETYHIGDDKTNVYAAGFYIPSVDSKPKLFYIDHKFDSVELIHNVFLELMRDKYSSKIFYVDNLGNFDTIFILKLLALKNEQFKNMQIKEIYSFNITSRDKGLIKVVVKRTIDNKVRSVTLVDSYALLSSSLENLSKSYDVEVKKGKFPYDFVNKNTVFYEAVTPDISYYNLITNEQYNSMVKDN